ncbi:MAG: ATP-dependent helicase RecG, partial [Acetobacteraceae bacterium]|nr:ATP-dependent helicase RecG [Acetobacteraceae bacterium]
MNPDPLASLFAPLTSLRGMGPAVASLVARVAGGERVIDLLFHMPDSYLDRSARPTIRDAKPGTVATLAVEVVRHERPATSRQPWRIIVKDDTGVAELVFFRFTREASTPPGAKLLVSGKLDAFNGRLSIPHPDHLVPIEQADRIPVIEPVWPLTAGLWPRQIASGLAQALDMLPEFPEWHDPALLKREKWPPFAEALRAVQMPAAGEPDRRIRARLAYDELLAGQVAQALIRGRVRARLGQPLVGDSHLREVALRRFGFAPTPSQVRALAEIEPPTVCPRHRPPNRAS